MNGEPITVYRSLYFRAPMSSSIKSFAVIRLALLSGVLLLGAVCWVLTNQRGGGPQPGTDPASLSVFRVLVPALCLGALAVAAVLRGRVARTRDAARRDSMRLIAWSVGEGSALAGGVHYLLSGDPKLYVLGVVALLGTFIILPLRDA